jgi:hypothetical protein
MDATRRLELFIRNAALMDLRTLAGQYEEVVEAGGSEEDHFKREYYRRLLVLLDAIADLKFPFDWENAKNGDFPAEAA